jgi:prefoldin subunit 5
MSRIRIYGDSTGYVELKAPDVAGNTTVEIPEGSFVGQTEFNQAISDINDDIDELDAKLSDVEAIAILGF